MKIQITVLFVSIFLMLGFWQTASAQSVNPTPESSTISATGSIVPLSAPMPAPLLHPDHALDAETTLSYFDNSLNTISFGVATIGQYVVYALGERMTLPTSTGFVDSVVLTLASAAGAGAGDSVAIVLFPDTLYQTPGGTFHLINIVDPTALPYATAWVPTTAINGPTNVTIKYPHVAVPRNFFVVVSANVNSAQHTITSSFSMVGDRKPVITRTTDNAHSGFLAFVGVNPTTSLFDSTFLDNTSEPIYSDWYITSYVQTAQGSVAIGSGQNGGLSVFPNPAVSHLSVSAPSGFENGTLELRDMLGRIALPTEQVSVEPLDVSGLAPGRYEAVLHSSKGVSTTPVIIQR